MAHLRLLRLSVILLIVPFFFFSRYGSMESADSADNPIRIFPDSPIFSQPFFVIVSGQWANSCVPIFDSVETSQNTVRVEARTPGPLVPCADIPTEWAFSLLVPSLLPDEYRLDVYVVSGITNIPTFFAGANFTVQGGIDISPALPGPTDAIVIRLAELNPDSCVPRYLSHSIIGGKVTIEAEIANAVCGQVATPWEMRVDVDPLEAGSYQVELYVTDYNQNPPQRRLYASKPLIVPAQIFRYYLPLWGCFGQSFSPLDCPASQSPNRQGAWL